MAIITKVDAKNSKPDKTDEIDKTSKKISKQKEPGLKINGRYVTTLHGFLKLIQIVSIEYTDICQ